MFLFKVQIYFKPENFKYLMKNDGKQSRRNIFTLVWSNFKLRDSVKVNCVIYYEVEA